jgi:hypothetical protein
MIGSRNMPFSRVEKTSSWRAYDAAFASSAGDGWSSGAAPAEVAEPRTARAKSAGDIDPRIAFGVP